MDPEDATSPPSMGPFSFPAGNDDFRAARDRCARACRAFNDTHEDAAPAERASRWLDIVRPVRNRDEDVAPVIHDMTFTKVKGTRKADIPFVKPPFHADYGLRLRVGGSTFINRFCMVLDTPVADITIGERCKIGPHLCIAAAGHALSPAERSATRSSLGKGVSIGDDVWIGANVTILGGVTIGHGAVIGAGSVVTSDIKPGWSAYGVPARHQRCLLSLPPDQTAGHFETLQESLNDGGMVDAFLREQLPRARRSTSDVWGKHQPPQNALSVSKSPSYPRNLVIALAVSVTFCIFLLGVLVGSKRMLVASGPGPGVGIDTL